MQQDVMTWLTLLPVVLAAFRVITLGDRLFAGTVTGRAGGETSAQSSIVMAGLTFVGLTVLLGVAGGDIEGSRFSLALVVLALGGLLLSHYILQGFRDRQWQGFAGAALQEAALYWLFLGAVRTVVDLNPSSAGIELLAAVWTMTTLISAALILGTFARMFRQA